MISNPSNTITKISTKKIVEFSNGFTYVLEPYIETFIMEVLLATKHRPNGMARVSCIKFLRAHTKLGLLEAKLIVDYLVDQLLDNHPFDPLQA